MYIHYIHISCISLGFPNHLESRLTITKMFQTISKIDHLCFFCVLNH